MQLGPLLRHIHSARISARTSSRFRTPAPAGLDSGRSKWITNRVPMMIAFLGRVRCSIRQEDNGVKWLDQGLIGRNYATLEYLAAILPFLQCSCVLLIIFQIALVVTCIRIPLLCYIALPLFRTNPRWFFYPKKNPYRSRDSPKALSIYPVCTNRSPSRSPPISASLKDVFLSFFPFPSSYFSAANLISPHGNGRVC